MTALSLAPSTLGLQHLQSVPLESEAPGRKPSRESETLVGLVFATALAIALTALHWLKKRLILGGRKAARDDADVAMHGSMLKGGGRDVDDVDADVLMLMFLMMVMMMCCP